MRHVLGFILAIILAAAVYAGASWGFVRLHAATKAVSSGNLLHDTHALLAIAALAGVALLGGILLVAPRVSPLATVLPGLVLLALTVYYVVNVHQALALIPMKGQDFGRGFRALLEDGALGAAGLVMIIPLFVPSRWRRRDRGDEEPGSGSGLLADLGDNPTLVQ